MSEILKPCPFCGGEAEINTRYIGYGSIGLGAHDWYTVVCKNCDTRSHEYKAKIQAIDAWNLREKQDVKPVQ